MSLKVAISGAAGYIGSVLKPYLERRGYNCIGFDIGLFKDCLISDNYQESIIWKDVREITKKDLKGIDIFIHLAGIANDPFGKLDPKSVFDPVREYTLNIASLCKEMNIKFIFASSCSIYGKAGTTILNEESDPNPVTPYSINKLQSENDLKSISDKNFSPIALRLSTLFGSSPRLRFDMAVNMFVGMAMTQNRILLNSNGLQWRPFVHIMDVCKAFEQCIVLDYNNEDLLILNVGNNENNIQVIELVNKIRLSFNNCQISFLSNSNSINEQEIFKDEKLQDGVDSRTYKVSFDRIKKICVNFKCEYSIDEGIKDLINFYNELPLVEEKFNSINFYRLQKLNELYKDGLIDKNLIWKN